MKNILITGAGMGIGFAVAKALYLPDNKLILVTRDKKSLKKLTANFPEALAFAINFINDDELEGFISKIKKSVKKLDVLINNAGIYVGKKYEKTEKKDLDRLYMVNLRTPFILTQKLLPLLKKTAHPQVINISSAANFARLPAESAYTAIKAGLSALSEVLQKELQKHRIRITTIHPWTVNTHNFSDPQNCLRPEDIGELILYIINTHPNCNILNIELSSVSDWRGGWPPWVEQ